MKLPPALLAEVQRYTDGHRMSMSDLVRAGLTLRLIRVFGTYSGKQVDSAVQMSVFFGGDLYDARGWRPPSRVRSRETAGDDGSG